MMLLKVDLACVSQQTLVPLLIVNCNPLSEINVFNRPGVAWAVLQSPPLLID